MNITGVINFCAFPEAGKMKPIRHLKARQLLDSEAAKRGNKNIFHNNFIHIGDILINQVSLESSHHVKELEKLASFDTLKLKILLL